MSGRGRSGVSYTKNEEPAFIKAFKQRVGYKEGPTIDSKREELQYEEEDRSDNEDELPQIVVLKDGDLSAEEVKKAKEAKGDQDEDEEAPADGRIIFKKPVKRQSDSKSELQVSSSKKTKEEKMKKKSKSKDIKNSSLLSFGDEEEEEDT